MFCTMSKGALLHLKGLPNRNFVIETFNQVNRLISYALDASTNMVKKNSSGV